MMKYFIQKWVKEKIEENGREPKITPKMLAKFKQASCKLKEALSAEQEANF